MADAKLNPRQLVEVLRRLDEIEKHSKGIRQQLIEVMAQRRRDANPRRTKRSRHTKR
jgi:hypothetical protein